MKKPMKIADADLIQGSIQHELVVASRSGGLQRLLAASGLAFRVVSLNLDEISTEHILRDKMPDIDPADVAELLVQEKIGYASSRYPEALIIAAQQVISLDGMILNEPNTMDAARDLLFKLRGKTHQLHSAVALCGAGEIFWTNVNTVQIAMRSYSAQFVGRYLGAVGPHVCEWPGAYELDGIGIQLVDRIEGDYLSALGVPLLQLFARLRENGYMAS